MRNALENNYIVQGTIILRMTDHHPEMKLDVTKLNSSLVSRSVNTDRNTLPLFFPFTIQWSFGFFHTKK